MTTLAELCSSLDYGNTASAYEDPTVGPKFLRITDIVPDLIDWSTVPHCAIEESKRDKFLLDAGDIVVARNGATVGYAKQVWGRPEGATFASYLVRFRPDPLKVDAYYLGQVVQSSPFKKWVKSVAGGAAQPNANAKLLGAFEVPLPSPVLPRKIGTALRAIAALIENNRWRIVILEQMARLIDREWFVHFSFPGHQDVELIDSDLGPIPKGWDVTSLAEHVELSEAERESRRLSGRGVRPLLDPWLRRRSVASRGGWFPTKHLLLAGVVMNPTEPGMVLRDGSLVVLEGLDSAGKSTQAEALGQRLQRRSSAVSQLHMPSGDSDVTRVVYEAMEGGRLESPFARQLFHLACHAANASRIAELRANGGLLLDRWWWSTHSYGVRSADLSEGECRALEEVIEVVWGGVVADVVFLFLHPFSIDRHNVAGVEAAYRELAAQHPDVAVVVPEGEVEARTESMLGELQRRGLLVVTVPPRPADGESHC